MVDFDCKTQLASPGRRTNLTNRPPSPSSSSIIKLQIPSLPLPFRPSTQLSPTSESTSAAYEQYLRLNELHSLSSSSTTNFPGWETEPLLKPSLQALEITFRFISIVFSDPRPYSNHLEWTRRLESLATKQIDIIARICEDDYNKTDGSITAPIFNSSYGVLDRRGGSSAEVWRISSDESDSSTATATVVSRVSEASLLPRLAAWGKSERVATKIMYAIECAMRNCPYTLGLGEPNLSGKPILDYDAVCKPSELHVLKKSPTVHVVDNQENQTIYSVHQILECWIQASKQVLTRIEDKVDKSEFEQAASECWLLEQIWNLLEEIERIHLLMDPDDFLRVKAQLRLGSGCGSDQAFCFRSKGLIELTKRSKDLKHKVPVILGVEVDPMGGPIIQEAAMKLYKEEKKQMFDKIHLLQALQGVEVALKRFYFGYKQVLVVVMGSLNANGNGVMMESVMSDSLAQIFLEPTYYPSLDGAKTFLGGFWERA